MVRMEVMVRVKVMVRVVVMARVMVRIRLRLSVVLGSFLTHFTSRLVPSRHGTSSMTSTRHPPVSPKPYRAAAAWWATASIRMCSLVWTTVSAFWRYEPTTTSKMPCHLFLVTPPPLPPVATAGLKSLLVLSGVTSEEKLLSDENKITPDFYADSIVDFYP
jgi:hypothetical protein